MLKEKEKHRLSKISELIFMASKEVKVLRHITWPEEVRINFFKNNCKKIPNVSYPKYNDSDLNSILDDAEQLFGDTKFDDWLRKKVVEIKKSSKLLSVCGTKDFFKISSDIYGLPTTQIHDKTTKPRDLSDQFEEIINSIDSRPIMRLRSPKISSSDVVNKISKSVNTYFGEEAPKIKLVNELSAKATASSKTIKIRKDGELK